MKKIQVSFIALAAVFLLTCKSTKQNSAGPVKPVATDNSAAPAAGIGIMMAKPNDGVYAPGEEELSAYKPYNKDITIDKLNKGYSLYAQSACIQCHSAKNIYEIKASDWNSILEDMAQKAKITNEQKDAVYDYVLAVKTAKLKRGN